MKRTAYDHNKIQGPDACIETSLKEFGCAWIESENDVLFYYGIAFDDEYTKFDFCTFDKNTNIKDEFDWIDNWNEINDYIGMNITDLSFPYQILELYRYYGYQNIFGECYWEGLTYTDIVKGDE